MIQWIDKKRNKKGFTLVELVVVIAILGILAAIAVPKLTKSSESASNAAHNANVRTLESAATLAFAEGLTFTESEPIIWSSDTETNYKTNDGNGWKDYLQSWPEIPKGFKNNDVSVIEDYEVTIKPDGSIDVNPDKTK